ncbi:MAG: Sodium ABC transporter permease [Shouchella clausii]|jgi:ABC-2 type transport system permease protein
MNNFWTIVGHTAGSRLKAKSFIISTVVIMAIVIIATNLSSIISAFSGDEENEVQQVAIIDETENAGDVATILATTHEESLYSFSVVEDASLKATLESARDGDYDYVLHLNGSQSELNATLYGGGDDYEAVAAIEQEVQRVKEAVLTSALNLSESDLAAIFEPITFAQEPLEEGGAIETEESQMQASFTVLGVTYVLFFIIVSFGVMIATEVAVEKSSRVMELIVSSVNPVVQMFGKLVGIGLVGIVNMVAIGAALVIGMLVGGNEIGELLSGDFIDMSLLGYAFFLTILGYFLFGGVAATLGALVSRTEDVNSSIQPLTFIAMAGFFIVSFGLSTPDAPFITVASYIPFFTPQLLTMRIGMGVIAGWEIALLFALLIASVVAVNILAARVYKGGVLMYGKVSMKEGIKQALALSKKEK